LHICGVRVIDQMNAARDLCTQKFKRCTSSHCRLYYWLYSEWTFRTI